MTIQKTEIPYNSVLFEFKRLQKAFDREDVVASVLAYPSGNVSIEAVPAEYEMNWYAQWRVRMFDYYTEDLLVEDKILAYLEEEEVVPTLCNDNLVYEYAECAYGIKECISLEQFLVVCQRYKKGDRPKPITSILNEYLGESSTDIIHVKELCSV